MEIKETQMITKGNHICTPVIDSEISQSKQSNLLRHVLQKLQVKYLEMLIVSLIKAIY